MDKARDMVGSNQVLGFRISADEFQNGGLNISESRVLAKMMVDHSSDFIHVSAGTPASGPKRYEEMEAGTYVQFAGEIKKEVNVPVICVGWITGLDRAEEILSEGTADLVAIGRALIADHDLLKKYHEDRVEDVVECIHCGECVESMFADDPKGYAHRVFAKDGQSGMHGWFPCFLGALCMGAAILFSGDPFAAPTSVQQPAGSPVRQAANGRYFVQAPRFIDKSCSF